MESQLLAVGVNFEVVVGDFNAPSYTVQYKSSKSTFQPNFSYVPEWSDRVNFHVIANSYREVNFSDMKADIDQLGQVTVDLSSKSNSFLRMTFGFSELLIIMLLLCVLSFIIWKKYILPKKSEPSALNIIPLLPLQEVPIVRCEN